MPDPIPDPNYVRYTGPGDAYVARWTLGPYRVLTETDHGVPVALPPDVAAALVAYQAFEHVDPVEAAAEIVAEDQRRAAEQAGWEAQQAEIKARKRRDRELSEIEGARLEAMRIAAAAARDADASQSEIVAAATTAEHEFRQALTGIDEGA